MSVNKIIVIFGIILVVFISVILFQFTAGGGNKTTQSTTKATQDNTATSSVNINGQTFKVTVADTPEKQQQGLSGRDSLPLDHGMLFLFNKPGTYSFWMKDMKFPIDIIFILNDKVVYVVHNAPKPDRNKNLPIYQPPSAVNKVFEINAGLAKKYTIKEGDKVTIGLKK